MNSLRSRQLETKNAISFFWPVAPRVHGFMGFPARVAYNTALRDTGVKFIRATMVVYNVFRRSTTMMAFVFHSPRPANEYYRSIRSCYATENAFENDQHFR